MNDLTSFLWNVINKLKIMLTFNICHVYNGKSNASPNNCSEKDRSRKGKDGRKRQDHCDMSHIRQAVRLAFHLESNALA